MNGYELMGYLKGRKDRIILLDGATGTELHKAGMPNGVAPELWVLEHPEILAGIQESYLRAGAEILFTCSLGGTRTKLLRYGAGNRVREINRDLAAATKSIVGVKGLVAGDIGPTGELMEPVGELDFEECVTIYKEQVSGLLEGGADLFVIETMMDIREARAALIAVKESCSLPVFVSMSYDEKGRTLTGTDPVTALITLQSLGADAVGCNCSTGPEPMVGHIAAMKPYARVPLFAKPNAGLPRLVKGETVFDMNAGEFAARAADIAAAGACLIGGCCGTTPEYIALLKDTISTRSLKPLCGVSLGHSALTSATNTVFFGKGYPLTVIGERINPTGKKKLQEELKNGINSEVRSLAEEQVRKGALILDVNVGMPGIDEAGKQRELALYLSGTVRAPLCFDTSSPKALEAALRVYPGRALVNSITMEEDRIAKMLPIAAKYGAMIIALPLDGKGVPEKAEQRCAIIDRIFKEALKYGYTKNDIVADGLVMTVSSNQDAALQTLNVIRWCSEEFGCPTVIGLSNVSFGLPERQWINSAFLAMAAACGLTSAIANPSNELLINIKTASDVLLSTDPGCKRYISHFVSEASEGNDALAYNGARLDKAATTAGSGTGGSPGTGGGPGAGELIYDAVVRGDRENISGLVESYLRDGAKAKEIIDSYLIPAINKVGNLYEMKKYYLPQLIGSAETMKAGITLLEPILAGEAAARREAGKAEPSKAQATVVLATVKGDIHDIGKNIVALMLKNYGFNVIDLGKDVDSDKIISEAGCHKADIVGLSALMTTTMPGMRDITAEVKKRLPECRVMIGGAVVDNEYAREIGADGYAGDAYGAVMLARRLLKMS